MAKKYGKVELLMKKTDKVEKKDNVAAEEVKDKDTVASADADKKVKKDKATKKAEKAEKKAAKKAQRKADRKNPEIKAAKKILAIKCIAAILCAVIINFSISGMFTSITDIVKMNDEQAYKEAAQLKASQAAGSTNNGGDSSNGGASSNGDASSNGGASSNGDASPAPAEPAPEPGEKDESGAPVKPADGIQTLEYFNSAINKVKTGASSVEQKKVENYLASSPTIPSALNSIYKMLGGDSWLDKMLKDNSQGAATLKGADIKAKFPVEGESYASQLQPADVKAATCTEANGIYTITITTLPDAKSTAHKHGTGRNPKAFNVILPGTVNDNIPGVAKSLVGEAAMAYPSSTVTITVDAATGNVLTANYDLKWTISFTKMNAVIPLGTRSNYEIKW